MAAAPSAIDLRSDRGAARLIELAWTLREAVGSLAFSLPVTHVYNPLDYAWSGHEEYLRRYSAGHKRVLFLGMNPGPYGMAQTGVPFGEIAAVTDWLGIKTRIGQPSNPHPKRPVTGFECKRTEVSGRRLWGLFAQRFPDPAAFFKDHLVVNYCPLAFMEATGRNRTPDKLAPAEREALFRACDAHLRSVVLEHKPEWVIGVGDFATRRAEEALDGDWNVGRILHPSPASPAANRDWAGMAARQLHQLGVWT